MKLNIKNTGSDITCIHFFSLSSPKILPALTYEIYIKGMASSSYSLIYIKSIDVFNTTKMKILGSPSFNQFLLQIKEHPTSVHNSHVWHLFML